MGPIFLRWHINTVYSGEDYYNYINGGSTSTEGDSTSTGGSSTLPPIDSTDAKLPALNSIEKISNLGTFLDYYKQLSKDFKHNPIGTIVTWFLDVIIKLLGDWVQILANSFMTVPLHTASDWQLRYSYEFLEKDGVEEVADGTTSETKKEGETDEGAGNRNIFTKVGEYEEGGGEKWQKRINIDDSKIIYGFAVDNVYNEAEDSADEDYHKYDDEIELEAPKDDTLDYLGRGFTKDTPIPVTPVDWYAIAKGNISLTDVNFLVVDEDLHEKDSVWWKIRDFATLIMHVTMYLAAAMLITALVWNGINLVKASITPQEKVNHMKGLYKFGKGVLMLIGVVVIMALGIYGNRMFLDDIDFENNDELPIRVNVKDRQNGAEVGIYSFSTNITGYVRYMAQISNVDLYHEKALYTFAFILLAWVNLITVIFMAVRMAAMLVLGIIGPIIVVQYLLNKRERAIKLYLDWIDCYVGMAMIQIVMAIVCKIIFETSFLD